MMTPSLTRRLSEGQSDAVSVAEAQAQCRIADDSENELLRTLIKTAQGFLESHYSVVFSESVFVSEFAIRSEGMRRFYLPHAPLVKVNSVQYNGMNVEASLHIGISTAYLEFPTPLNKDSYLIVEYTAGFADGKVPEDVKRAALLLITHYYDNRNPETSVSVNKIGYSVDALMLKYKQILVA